jgi:hypothetical protein
MKATSEPAKRALEFGPFLSLCFAKFGGSDREDAFLRLRAEEIVEAKPEKSQARNAGDANKAQGEASAVCERNPGLARRESQAHEVGARDRAEFAGTLTARPNGRISITRFAGSVLIPAVPRVPLRASLGFGAPLHPGLYSDRPHSRAWLSAGDRPKAKVQSPRSGRKKVRKQTVAPIRMPPSA